MDLRSPTRSPRCPAGGGQRPPDAAGAVAPSKDRPDVRRRGPPVSRVGVEPVDRLGLRCVRGGSRSGPVRAALTNAHRHGITVFDATGDVGGPPWAARTGRPHPAPTTSGWTPSPLPEITSGRRHHAVDRSGREVAARSRPGSTCRCRRAPSGDVAAVPNRPGHQRDVSVKRDRRATGSRCPAVADRSPGPDRVRADPADRRRYLQAAPIWASLTVLMNQYLSTTAAPPVGDITPALSGR